MPPEHFGFTHDSREALVAGNAVTVEGTKMIPVSRVQAFAGGKEGKGAGGFGGSAKVELVGTYLVSAGGSEKWLPVEPEAPEGFADWPSWLQAQPELMKQIREKLR